MDNELTGTTYVDAHRLRGYKDGTYQNILDLIPSPGGIATTVQGGSGINVTETTSQQILTENTTQNQTGAPGADSAFQTITVNNGVGEHTCNSTTVNGVKLASSAFGELANGILTTSGLKGDAGKDGSTPSDGIDGKDSAMQKITV